MRRQMKMDGYIDVPDAVLRAELRTDYAALREDEKRPKGAPPFRRIYVAVLSFGDYELGCWDVTEHRAKFEPQPGDHWDSDDRESHEEDFVAKFVGEQIAPIFRGLPGVIPQ